jgi:hypothetical protein
MALSWIAVDAKTGNYLAEFPNLVPQGPCAVTMGRYESLNVALPYPDSVIAYSNDGTGDMFAAIQDLTDWKTATRPGAAVIVALDEADQPIWGGLVLTRTRDNGSVATLSLVTLEAYLERRYVGTYTGTGVDSNVVVKALIDNFIATGALPGLPIRVVNSASAVTQTVAYVDTQDITVYSALTTLSGSTGGPQWTIGFEWQDSPRRVTPVLTVADRLGSSKPSDLAAPNALFNMPGCVQSFQVIEDYSTGKGANRVTAVDPGQTPRLQYSADAADSLMRPLMEFRYSPVASTSSVVLTPAQHAMAALAITQDGIKTIALTANVFGDDGEPLAPVLNTDCEIGGDIAYDLMAPGFIDGELSNQTAAMYGWQRTNFTFTPIAYVKDASTA